VSIRLRVTLATVLLVGLALATADFTAYALLRRDVYSGANASVHRVAATAVAAVNAGRRLELSMFSSADRPLAVELRAGDGTLLERASTRDGAQLKLPASILSNGRSADLLFNQTVDAIAVPAGRGTTVVAAVALGSEATVLRHLSKLNDVIGIAVIAVSALVAAVVLTFSLRPLRRIAATADAIGGGDLVQRAPDVPPRSEIGRVATALNRMLDQIQAAFAQRDATENRLRRFLSDASHELRTPLTSIRGYAELFRRGAQSRPEDLAGAMRAIEDEAARMAQLVDDLLLLARLDEERPSLVEPVALDEVVRAAVEAAKVIEPDRPLDCHIEQPVIVVGDAAALRRAIDNLLGNARRHTPAGAAVSVGLRRVAGDVVLTVADTGPGIPAADRERIFDRFFRPDDARTRGRGGTGLGLAIVQAIVTAHDGRVSVGNVQPHGAVFELRLPLVSDPLAARLSANSRPALG
jgi:two-component system OmpR family sensor kinase